MEGTLAVKYVYIIIIYLVDKSEVKVICMQDKLKRKR